MPWLHTWAICIEISDVCPAINSSSVQYYIIPSNIADIKSKNRKEMCLLVLCELHTIAMMMLVYNNVILVDVVLYCCHALTS